ncbi:MAG: hypothetical protein U1F43_34140 [Myxococcota bacterium]
MSRESFITFGEVTDGIPSLTPPSALLSDGAAITVPLHAVTAMTLNESFHVPPVGSSAAQRMAASSADTVTLNGLLVGPTRFALKQALELLADASVRGSALSRITGGKVGGLFLLTSMTIRTDMYVQSLAFSVSTTRRQTIDVVVTLVHQPPPGSLALLLDLGAVAASTLRPFLP